MPHWEVSFREESRDLGNGDVVPEAYLVIGQPYHQIAEFPPTDMGKQMADNIVATLRETYDKGINDARQAVLDALGIEKETT